MKCSYKGDLKNIADPIVHKMLERQVEQGNTKDVTVFEKRRTTGRINGGFDWFETPEDHLFWKSVLEGRNHDLFFEKYPELAEATQEAQVLVAVRDDELMDLLNRIESKLDKLLRENNSEKVVKFASGGIVVQDKSQDVKEVEFKPGDRVRVKSWKEIKKLTEKGWDSRRLFDNGLVFTANDRRVSGFEGVVVSPISHPYITINVNGELYALAPQALEKLKP